ESRVGPEPQPVKTVDCVPYGDRPDAVRQRPPAVACLARPASQDGARDLVDLLYEAQRQAAHPLQRRGGRGAVLRLDRQYHEAGGRGSLGAALLAAPALEPALGNEPGLRSSGSGCGTSSR